ncbi:MAG: hypothetical protein KDB73_19860 [Planctomycetes bacterium]|nr:hypothetical protein [Planctomycetota bacterium]
MTHSGPCHVTRLVFIDGKFVDHEFDNRVAKCRRAVCAACRMVIVGPGRPTGADDESDGVGVTVARRVTARRRAR